MNTQEFEKLLSMEHNGKPIVLESGIYDAQNKVIHADCGIIMSEPGTIFRNATILGCVTVSGCGSVLQNCMIKAENHAIFVAGSDIVIRENEIEAPAAILVEPYSERVLVAQNNTHGDIKIDGAVNCSVVLNRANKLTVENSTSVSVAECDFDGKVTLKNNNYLLCDNNSASAFESVGNQNINGDNITDITVRPEYGANEDILPHPNKELFVGLAKKKTVADANYDEMLGLNEYIRREAKEKHIVIVPPGAYSVDEPLFIRAEQSNSKIYAYGVYSEISSYGNHTAFQNAQNVEIHGLVAGYADISCGQAYVLEVIDDRHFTVIPAAGWRDEFGRSDTEFFNRGEVNTFKSGVLYPWGDLGAYSIERIDGKIFMVTLDEKHSTKIGQMQKGDVLSCRIGGVNKSSMPISDSQNILLRDCMLYGYSSALAVTGSGNTTGARLERFVDTVKSAPVIDEETYNFYKSLEEKYRVTLEVSIDDKGRYRGAIPRVCSVDATHLSGARRGLSATSCIFDAMCDDGTNQHADSSRIAAIIDNGDGTTTIRYKGCISLIHFQIAPDTVLYCPPFQTGDNIFVYTSKGRLVCDTHTLSASRQVDSIPYSLTELNLTRDYTIKVFEVTVPTEDVNFSAIEGFDFSDNHFRVDNKVFVDNLDRNCSGYTFDNVLMKNARGRGVLVKTSGVVVKNCTFRDMLHAGIFFSAEATWGESSVAKDALVEKCLFERTSFRNNDNKSRRLSPIVISGLCSDVSEDSLLYKNITIRNNKFTGITHECIASITAAQKVRLENNIFERDDSVIHADNAMVVEADTVMDITLKGNKYPVEGAGASRIVKAKNFKNITVEDEVLEGDID